ncbi:MAG TPA: cyclic nucleotide-binding domain-containing protein [Anaerolineae bacterium]|nr:cyclic nucleotide-binding domain-containing protein [Anaerolineae bacterium]
MNDPQPATMLRGISFLKTLDEEGIEQLARKLVAAEYQSGQIIVEAGRACDGLYFLLEGSIERLPPGSSPDETGQPLSGGDTFGALELVYDQSWTSTYIAREPTQIYLWKRRDAEVFFQKQPAALADLRFKARSHRLARSLNFTWLNENEIIDGLACKHPALLVRGLLVPAMLVLAGAALLWWGPILTGDSLIWLAAGVVGIGMLYGVWQWVDWGNDYYMVTNRRVVRLEKVVGIYDSRREAPLHNVLSFSVSTTFLGRLLGFGDLIIRTFTGQIVFPNIPNPYAMAGVLENQWHRVYEHRLQEDRASKINAVRGLTAAEAEVAFEPSNLEETPPDEEPRGDPQNGLGRWSFKVRFEEQGVITYRKHWAVLMRRVVLPSIAILLLAGLIGARLGETITLLPLGTFLQLSGLLIIGLVLYWLYEFVDWANDIYQITPTQIVDVHRKPLAREMRKVAPLESILGTEVDRKGIIGLMLNYGDVISNIGTEQFLFEGVFDPVGVQQDIVRGMEAIMERKLEKQRREKRDEMVEWLGVYHQEYNHRKPEEPEERHP